MNLVLPYSNAVLSPHSFIFIITSIGTPSSLDSLEFVVVVSACVCVWGGGIKCG